MIRWLFCITFLPSVLFAQGSPTESTPTPKAWKHESEGSIVQVGGNTKSESHAVKQKTTYQLEKNIYSIGGRYLQAKSGDLETARAWDIVARYERELSELWSVFLQHGAESDEFAGYRQRDNTDLGGKYFIKKTASETWFMEAGARYSKLLATQVSDPQYSTSGRLYTEYVRVLSESLTAKLWIEYVPNFTDWEAYLLNSEASLNVMLTEVFSLKMAYLSKYHNKLVGPSEVRQDTTFTTSIVAKF